MKKERILSYALSQKMKIQEIEKVCAGSMATSWCANGSFMPHGGGWDAGFDMSPDF